MHGAQQHLARAGEAEGGDRGEQRHEQGRERAGDLVGEAGAGFVGRAAGGLELGDAAASGSNNRARSDRPWRASAASGVTPCSAVIRGTLADDVHVGVVDPDVLEQPVAGAGRGIARSALDHALQDAAGAVVDA